MTSLPLSSITVGSSAIKSNEKDGNRNCAIGSPSSGVTLATFDINIVASSNVRCSIILQRLVAEDGCCFVAIDDDDDSFFDLRLDWVRSIIVAAAWWFATNVIVPRVGMRKDVFNYLT